MNETDHDYILYYSADATGKSTPVGGGKARWSGRAEEVKNGEDFG